LYWSGFRGTETVQDENASAVRMVFIVDEGAPHLLNSSVIASGFPEPTDPAALVIGPTGVAFDPTTGDLLVADSLENRIAAIPNALFRTQIARTGRTVSAGGAFNDPLGVSLIGKDLFVANRDDGNIVEVNIRSGKQIDVDLVDSSGGPPPGSGALFGLWALKGEVFFVDDATNTFNLLH
jgi:DNA-binding beta-propeller fold protein YncE